MLNWLKRRFGFSGRDIFKYWDGTRYRYGDPVAIERAIKAECPDWKVAITFLEMPDVDVPMPPEVLQRCQAEQEKAFNRLVDVSRKVFGLKPLDDGGNGLTESASLNVLADFVAFTGLLIEEAAPFLKSPGLSGPSPATPVTGPSADSISAANTSPAGSPKLSPGL